MLPTGQKRQNEVVDQDMDSDDSESKPVKRNGRRKIKIEYIEDKNRRHITFSKRKAGIMKKAYELSTLTGTQVLLLVVSETGLVYTFTTTKLQPIVTKPEGKNLIQTCLNTPDPNVPEMPETASASNNNKKMNESSVPSTPPSSSVAQSSSTTTSPMMPSTSTNQQQQQQQQSSSNAYSQPPNTNTSMPPQMPPFNNQQRYPGNYNGNVPQPTQPYPPQQQQQQPTQQPQQPYGQPFYGQPNQPYPTSNQQQGYWTGAQQTNTSSPTQRHNVKQEQ